MKKKFHKTLFLISTVCILILSFSIVAFAAYADSPYKYATVYGYDYDFKARIYNTGTYVTAETLVVCNDGNVPTGYMGAQARLYNSDGLLKLSSSWVYNDRELAGFKVKSI
ncbi:hypothetical protein AN618_24160 [Fervidicola ferrireducens]|uniref:Uncharacterized protein n=1 Tax=Fervidicola ferrireducens TaxID=520764 RepID=A0A140L0F4_9FIRM|nr:hypothetical protein [Fervidicola ferrireducens]KXG74029.1 hypothetical protein AN618_24160 [Fervidicola ferrireducens]